MIVLACALVAWWLVRPAAAPPAFRSVRFETASGGTVQYALYTPPHVSSAPTHPLIVFLHGGRECGRDGARHLIVGPSVHVNRAHPDFYLLMYQAADEDWSPWSTNAANLTAAVEHAVAHFPIDPDRVSLTGHSSGGSGVWALAVANPRRWSALAPVCGIGDPATVRVLRHLPVWIFQGELDGQDYVANADAMARALRAAGGDVRYSRFPDEGHLVWPCVYLNTEVYAWLTAKRRTGGV
ncbi:MAG TPA: prolyl oligopeptidase family serine peptidase [Gemmata sp.]